MNRYVVLFLALLVLVAAVVIGLVLIEKPVAAPQLAGVAAVQPSCCVICTPGVTKTPTKTPTIVPTIPTRTPSPTEVRCSKKKGVAGGFVSDTGTLNDLLGRAGVSWYYSWILGGNVQWNSGYEFVPMLRTELDSLKAQIQIIIINRNYRGGYWLIGNEPDNTLQDNLSYTEAADVYGKILYYVKGLDPTAKFIMLGLVEPKTWWERRFSEAWKARWGEQPPVAGWALHMYVNPASGETIGQARDRLLQWMNGWIADHPGKELWITEFGELQTKNMQIIGDTMVRFGNAFEETPGVTRYAFFGLGSDQDHWQKWSYTSLFVKDPVWPSETMLLFNYAHLVPTNEPAEPCE